MAHLIDLRKKQKEALGRLEALAKRSDYSVWPEEKVRVYPKLKNKIKADVTSSVSIPRSEISQQIPKSPKISWQAPSFYYNPQKKYLSLAVVVLVAAGGGFLFFQKDTLTAIFLMLTSLMFVLYANKKPTISDIIIDNSGIIVGGVSYYYRDLKSFWIDYNPGFGGTKELSLESRSWYVPYIKVSIENRDPIEIRSLMINFLPEKEHEASIVDLIAKRIGL